MAQGPVEVAGQLLRLHLRDVFAIGGVAQAAVGGAVGHLAHVQCSTGLFLADPFSPCLLQVASLATSEFSVLCCETPVEIPT